MLTAVVADRDRRENLTFTARSRSQGQAGDPVSVIAEGRPDHIVFRDEDRYMSSARRAVTDDGDCDF